MSEDECDRISGEDDVPVDLRSGSDACYKCSTCDVSCPVAEVDDTFPGPKFQGPEQWRLKRAEDVDIDPSVLDCSNCMRCDSVCPGSVPLTEMHNRARGIYVEEQVPTFSRTYLRAKLLSNYGRLAAVASTFPRASTFLANNRFSRWIADRTLGITAEREFPAFARETFREWWRERGGPAVKSEDKRIAYFHGDYANYNTPGVGKALVRVFEAFGYEVAVPDQRCSGTPMFANGMLADAERAARFNVETFAELVAAGYDIICSCSSCSLALRVEYPDLFSFPDLDAGVENPVETVATHTWDAIEYLHVHEDLEGALTDTSVEYPDLAYHAPCHARNQGTAGLALEVLDPIAGVRTHDVGDSCSGISGTYGWKAEKYDVSMAIGEEMFEQMHAADANAGLTECPTCAMQMEHGTGYEISHPLEVLEQALSETPEKTVAQES